MKCSHPIGKLTVYPTGRILQDERKPLIECSCGWTKEGDMELIELIKALYRISNMFSSLSVIDQNGKLTLRKLAEFSHQFNKLNTEINLIHMQWARAIWERMNNMQEIKKEEADKN